MGMTRTPDEIKKGLECCISDSCNDCPYVDEPMERYCKLTRTKDSLALIQQLQADLEDMTARYKIADDCAKKKGEMNEKLYAELTAVKAERDAAVVCIGKLTVILKKYPYAATNGCAYEAYMEIKKYIEAVRGVPKEE